MNPVKQLAAGALLVGVSILSGNATLMTVAGGIGVNWTSDGLMMLWEQGVLSPKQGTPLNQAYRRAIEKAVRQLRTDYLAQVGRPADTKAFELIAASAADFAAVESLPVATNLQSAHEQLAAALPPLLLGHDERAVSYLQRNLLIAVARQMQTELVTDDKAWREYHGGLLRRLAHNITPPVENQAQVAEALARLHDFSAAAHTLTNSITQVEMLLQDLNEGLATQMPPVPDATFVFDNQGVKAKVIQQAQTIYDRSAHAEDEGSAIVVNDQTRSDE